MKIQPILGETPEETVGTLSYLAAITCLWALRAFALASLWLWYLVPLFKVPQISALQALGILLVVECFPKRRAHECLSDAQALACLMYSPFDSVWEEYRKVLLVFGVGGLASFLM